MRQIKSTRKPIVKTLLHKLDDQASLKSSYNTSSVGEQSAR
ncbi:hypothetical protein HMPREF9238_01530 [Gleimia europaea ACS-120-V-Col10b]|uniref:Uncharacterized protein n=1 Tax=Gleimia europaea ACS-120-V-Col10b TaxID=883069 RepID=A0A9W5RD85_9ACTO|nr:hypothetical protein HMPREF9238_01530 [Gleimia europaea ACS-120-V-Col10b]